jgi:hypothetical protein
LYDNIAVSITGDLITVFCLIELISGADTFCRLYSSGLAVVGVTIHVSLNQPARKSMTRLLVASVVQVSHGSQTDGEQIRFVADPSSTTQACHALRPSCSSSIGCNQTEPQADLSMAAKRSAPGFEHKIGAAFACMAGQLARSNIPVFRPLFHQ